MIRWVGFNGPGEHLDGLVVVAGRERGVARCLALVGRTHHRFFFGPDAYVSGVVQVGQVAHLNDCMIIPVYKCIQYSV